MYYQQPQRQKVNLGGNVFTDLWRGAVSVVGGIAQVAQVAAPLLTIIPGVGAPLAAGIAAGGKVISTTINGTSTPTQTSGAVGSVATTGAADRTQTVTGTPTITPKEAGILGLDSATITKYAPYAIALLMVGFVFSSTGPSQPQIIMMPDGGSRRKK